MNRDSQEKSSSEKKDSGGPSRRDLLRASGAGLAGIGLGGMLGGRADAANDFLPARMGTNSPGLDLSDLPNFCAHEHWGSITAIGHLPEGFRGDVVPGALPRREPSLLDLILEPYISGQIRQAGVNPEHTLQQALGAKDVWAAAAKSPVEALRALRPILRKHELTGFYQCTRRGLQQAYGFELNDDDNSAAIKAVNRAVAKNYRRLFDWYERQMKAAHFTRLVRPVHPEFYFPEQFRKEEQNAAAARDELAFTDTVMRIDPLLQLWQAKNARRDKLAKLTGVEPADARTWRAFLDKLFEQAATKKALGIKQLQAYSRDLDFAPRKDGEVKFRGALSADEVRAFQDWVLHECCARAHERRWVHQIHVGTHNLPHSNPLPLEPLFRRYPRQKVVMLHAWPFLDECAVLIRQHANAYVDTCWQPVLNPEFLRRSLQLWLGHVPTSNIMLSHDSTTVEMALGSAQFTREILAETLLELGGKSGLKESALLAQAQDLLHDNAARVYES